VDNCVRTFGRQTLSPKMRRKSPPNLYEWGERGMERRDIQPDEANEAAISPKFHGTQTEAVLSEMFLDSICKRITFLGGKSVRHELHNKEIGVQASEWFTVSLTPVAQDQALGRQRSPDATHLSGVLWSRNPIAKFTVLFPPSGGTRRHQHSRD
jgi:hypothetical protein